MDILENSLHLEDTPGSVHVGLSMENAFEVIWFAEITSLNASVSNIN